MLEIISLMLLEDNKSIGLISIFSDWARATIRILLMESPPTEKKESVTLILSLLNTYCQILSKCSSCGVNLFILFS